MKNVLLICFSKKIKGLQGGKYMVDYKNLKSNYK